MMQRRQLLLGLASAALSALSACRPRQKADPDVKGAPDSGASHAEGGAEGGAGGGAEESGAAPLCPNADPIGPAEPPEPGWVSVSLAEHPALRSVGGSVLISAPEVLLEVVLAQAHPDCFVAVWRVCTHGACELSWDAAGASAVCPCHGSRFGADGAVRVGPATRPLRTFPVSRQGDWLWIDARR
jgi:cytochrome b6-f complex iron-sulfur subunit